MIQQKYEFIVGKIAAATNLSRQEIERKVELKLRELQDLISKEGAAHIIANELKVQLFDNSPKVLKVKDVTAGMNAITLTGRVLVVYEPRSFTSGQRTGRVLNLMIGDETGAVKVVCWDENLCGDLSKLKLGDILKIKNAYTKENNSFSEVHLGGKAQILVNPEGESVGEVRSIGVLPVTKRKQIKDLLENDLVEVFGTVVQVYEPKFYNACPVCKKKVFPQESSFFCQEHGVVIANQVPIVNFFFDDGTGSIRAVCFREHAEKILGKDFVIGSSSVKTIGGKQLLLRGKVVSNAMFNRTEFVVSAVEDPDPEKLIVEMENVQ